ncbi:hypothetical protein [Microbacterium candidum]|uniref:Uncharacterized protein n=1 Tax=Microbacterium candidum TaxID=3041922 RepID=A0ABT7N2Q9_9MICO|nr:hypothetical protein [Microbacterium sp. ASV49]MDL9980977.1 hypothetical protein [Microbacterium sp. ASV49]
MEATTCTPGLNTTPAGSSAREAAPTMGSPPATAGSGLLAYFSHAAGALGVEGVREPPSVAGSGVVAAQPAKRRTDIETSEKDSLCFGDMATRFL